jgi:hypothetical protein
MSYLGLPNVDLELGVVYCDEPAIMKFGADDCILGKATVSHKLNSDFNLNYVYEHYGVMFGSSYSGGDIVGFGFSNIEPDDSLKFGISFDLLYDDGCFDLQNGLLVRGNMKLSWEVAQKWSLIPAMDYVIPLTVNDRDPNKSFSFAVGYVF